MAILFADVVGSTGLAERLGPDEWSDLMGHVHERVGRVVEAHGGTVAQVMGDGLLAFFGTPEAHEDDPLRAVHAGLDIVDAVRSSAGGAPDGQGTDGPGRSDGIQVRVGVETGVVVVGEVGTDQHVETLAFGDAVNVAARLQALATPMTVRISESAYRLVAGSVDVRDLGEEPVKGRVARVRTYEVLGIRAERPARGSRETGRPLIGRQRELAALLALSAQLRDGRGGALLITGEPGIGKTRLIAEWRASVEASGLGLPRWIEVSCQAVGRDQAYHVLIGLGRALAGIVSQATPSESHEGARAAVAAAVGSRSGDVWPYLAQLLSLPLEPDAAAVVGSLEARALQRQVGRSLRLLLAGIAERTPLVVIVEDVHWIDPSSAELLAGLLPLVAEVPLVFASSSRPDADPSGRALREALGSSAWATTPELVLGPLSDAETAELLHALLPDRRLGSDDERLVHARCGGNPFFVEEVVRVLVERASPDSGATPGSISGAAVIPETLHGLLVARIERLPEAARTVLRVASVMGRRFRVRVLSELALEVEDVAPDAVLAALDTAGAVGLVEPVAGARELEYAFRHALIQEASYDLIVKRDRAPLHRAVAEAIERADADRLDEVAVVLARHFDLGGSPVRAVAYLARGATVAASRFANAEALRLLEEALVLAQGIPGEGSMARLADLREQLGDLQGRSGHHDRAIEAWEAAYERHPPGDVLGRARLRRKVGCARVVATDGRDGSADLGAAEAILAAQGGERGGDWWCEWIEIQLGLIWKHYFRTDGPELQGALDRAREPVLRHGSAAQRAVYLGRLPLPMLIRCRFRVVDEDDTSARAYLEAAQEAGSAALLVEAHFTLGFWRLLSGALEDAEQHLVTCRRLAERIGDGTWECRARNYLTRVARLRRDAAAVREGLEGLERLARETGLHEYVAASTAHMAWLAWLDGDDAAAEQAARHSLAQSRASSPMWPFEWLALFPLLAIALARGDDVMGADLARQLLAPGQQLLEPEVMAPLEVAAAAKGDDAALTHRHLLAARDAAIRAGYL